MRRTNAAQAAPVAPAERRSCGFATLYRKELADHFHSARFKLVLLLLTLAGLASLFGALEAVSDANASSSEYVILALYTLSSNSIPSFASFLAYLAPLAGLALGFDAINRERAQGTLNRLVSQPIYRDAIINAKFLAGVTVIFLMIFFVGIPPEAEELLRIGAYLLLTVVYTSMWLGLSMLCSVLCRHAATSALIVIALWIYLTLFASMVVSVIANLAYPLDGIMGFYNAMDNYQLQLTLERASPYYLYCEAASTLLNPNIRTVGITTQASMSGALASYLTFDQSLLLIWPHLTCMVALVLFAFTCSYVLFMRQEIRA